MTRLKFTMLAALCLLACAGCLRQRWHSADEGFRDTPAVPTQDFGRRAEKRGQVGVDDRARDIESSLGIENSDRRLLNR